MAPLRLQSSLSLTLRRAFLVPAQPSLHRTLASSPSPSSSLGTGRLANKTTIITGSSSGLGRAIALRYAAEGARVVCADLKPDGPPAQDDGQEASTDALIRERFGRDKAVFVKCDVSVAPDVKDLVNAGTEFGEGRLDVMVNNAGICTLREQTMIHELDEEFYDREMKINARSVFLGCKYATAQFMKQPLLPDSGRRGWIVNTASVLAFMGAQTATAYCASKGAVLQLTKQVALDYAPHKIHCNALCPGFLKTPMTTHFREDEAVDKALIGVIPMKEWGDPDDVASAAVFLGSEDARFVTGHGLVVDGGWSVA